MKKKMLIINPGSTSTKISIYENETPLINETLRHDVDELNKFSAVIDQLDFRKNIILDALSKHEVKLEELAAVVARGGLLKPVISGTYEINDAMEKDLCLAVGGEHASNLGAILAREIAEELKIPSYIVDPPVVDELQDVARISGTAGIERTSLFHALNQKAVGKRYAQEKMQKYEALNLIIVHMGGGVTVGAHQRGNVIDVNNGLTGEGPFSPERAGSLPATELVKICFNSGLSEKDILKKINGKGGFVSYLNTNDVRKVVDLSENGDKEAGLILDAFCYQVSKAIGECAVVLEGKVDAIILTGGIAYNEKIIAKISEKVDWIAPITKYPGEDEMLALAQGGLRVLNGIEQVKVYQ